jgi:hypothetical protein
MVSPLKPLLLPSLFPTRKPLSLSHLPSKSKDLTTNSAEITPSGVNSWAIWMLLANKLVCKASSRPRTFTWRLSLSSREESWQPQWKSSATRLKSYTKTRSTPCTSKASSKVRKNDDENSYINLKAIKEVVSTPFSLSITPSKPFVSEIPRLLALSLAVWN